MKARLTLILLLVVLVLGLTLSALLVRIKALQAEYSEAMNNYKAYEELFARRLDTLNKKNYELKLTKEQLNYSRDSIIQKLNDVRKELKIKDKNIQRLEYILTQTTIYDSIFMTDTIFNDGVSIDTTLADQWRVLNLKLEYPNRIDIESTFNNELSVIVSGEKQTIKPPSKFFFVRWFQKKQVMVKVDVVDSNPYASIKEQRFVEIIK